MAGLHMEEILVADDLPLRYAGYSTCFRREAGAAGNDTRGMFRAHQFDKVEMFSYVQPEDSRDEHEHLLAIEEELVQEPGIPYRVVNVAAGDLGLSAAKKYDIEEWFPGQQHFREITSMSNTTDLQARRLGVRYRPERGRADGGAHAQRHRRDRPLADRDPRELPGRRRLGRGATGARALRRSFARRGRGLNRTRRRLSPSEAVAVAAAIVVVGITYWRSWYGVDLTDESFYVALPWRFAHGARPFVDETTVAQQAGLLVSPFVWVWRELVGVDGVVLYVRHLQFLFSLLVAAAVFVGLRSVLRSARRPCSHRWRQSRSCRSTSTA